MSHVELLFSRNDLIGSQIIRAVTWSKWSHVALIIDGVHVIESTMTHNGVQIATVHDFKARNKDWALKKIPCFNPDAVIAAAMSQIDKPYDYLACLGVFFKRDWQKEGAWDCAELIAWAFQQAGFPLFRADAIHRIVPQHIWMLAFPYTFEKQVAV